MLSYRKTGGESKALALGAWWMLDNGKFSGRFQIENWLRRMDEVKQYRDTCKGVILPDYVLFENGRFAGGDWKKTLEMAYQYAPLVRQRDLCVAYALQNDHPIEEVPWELFDTLFIGCADYFKFSDEVTRIGLKARELGKWVHQGRVISRSKIVRTWYADSFDSTGYIWNEDDKRRLAQEGIAIAERKQRLFDRLKHNKRDN
ncbi:MAG: hypothetical protein AAF902_03645 [Chloroflexota bacterium]